MLCGTPRKDKNHLRKWEGARRWGLVMTVTFTYDPDRGFVRARARGLMTPSEFRAFTEEIIADEEIPSDTDVLWDMQSFDFSLCDVDYLRELALIRDAYSSARKLSRGAFVVNHESEGYLVKLFGALRREGGLNIRFFLTFEEAEGWLAAEQARQRGQLSESWKYPGIRLESSPNGP